MFAVVSDASWVFEPLQIADEPFRMICHALAKEDFLYASTFLIHVLVAVHAVLRPIDAGVRRCLFALHTSWDNGARSRTLTRSKKWLGHRGSGGCAADGRKRVFGGRRGSFRDVLTSLDCTHAMGESRVQILGRSRGWRKIDEGVHVDSRRRGDSLVFSRDAFAFTSEFDRVAPEGAPVRAGTQSLGGKRGISVQTCVGT